MVDYNRWIQQLKAQKALVDRCIQATEEFQCFLMQHGRMRHERAPALPVLQEKPDDDGPICTG